MSDRPILLFDVDGVLADFRQLYVDCANFALGEYFTKEDLGHGWDFADALGLQGKQRGAVWDVIKQPGRVLHMNALPGAVDAVHQALEIGEVLLLTSGVPGCTWMQERVAWAGSIGVPADRVIFCNSRFKHLVKGNFFIDDRKETVDAWTAARTADTEPGKTLAWWANPAHPLDWDAILGELKGVLEQ